jgi:recombination protein RecT
MATATAPKPAAPAPKPPPATNSLTPAKLTTTNVGHFLFSPAVTKQIALALPHHLKPERMIRMALTTVRRTPALLECDPMSLVAGIVQASELGLELSGPLGQAYLIPRKNRGRMEATFQIGYRGFLRLAYNTGQVAVFNARAVEEGDFFKFVQGSENFVEHRPRETEGAARITHFYAILRQKGQDSHDGDCEVWPVEKMIRHRDRFRSDKTLKVRDKNYQGVWDTDFEAMGCKTLIRMISKRANLSADLMSLAARDEYAELGLPTPNTPIEFAAPAGNGNGHTPAGRFEIPESASPDALDEIDMNLQRTGLLADEGALAAFYDRFARGKDGEIDEATGAAMLKELNAMPDVAMA